MSIDHTTSQEHHREIDEVQLRNYEGEARRQAQELRDLEKKAEAVHQAILRMLKNRNELARKLGMPELSEGELKKQEGGLINRLIAFKAM